MEFKRTPTSQLLLLHKLNLPLSQLQIQQCLLLLLPLQSMDLLPPSQLLPLHQLQSLLLLPLLLQQQSPWLPLLLQQSLLLPWLPLLQQTQQLLYLFLLPSQPHHQMLQQLLLIHQGLEFKFPDPQRSSN